MTEKENNLYKKGGPNPDRMGFITVTSQSNNEDGAFDEKIEALCKVINKDSSFIDSEGFEIEIIAAANHGSDKWAWMESKAKETNDIVDISFTLYLYQSNQIVHSWEIETYNPYFGCDVSYMDWWEDSLITIYREKHCMYLACINMSGEDSFQEIEDDWCLVENNVFFRSYKGTEVQIAKLPSLELLPKLSLEEAKAIGSLPSFIYTESI